MAIDRIEFMTLDTLPLDQTGEVQVQLNMLKQLALHPDIFRLMFFHLPADVRLHAKQASEHIDVGNSFMHYNSTQNPCTEDDFVFDQELSEEELDCLLSYEED